MKKRIAFVITNDPDYDQRMQRICNSLQQHGYDVTLVGTDIRTRKKAKPAAYNIKQIHSIFTKGKLFYLEFQIKAFFKLLFLKSDAVCAIDLDSILPCLIVSRLRNKKRIYDAHELFCELPEVIARPSIRKAWKFIEKISLPHFKYGYTVSESISLEYKKMYDHDYATVRNIPVLKSETSDVKRERGYVLYQGALNEGRGMEYLIPAMQYVNLPLIICGEGNFSHKARAIVKELNLEDKVLFQGMIEPSKLAEYSLNALVGINLGDGAGLNNYLSLNNKFFDYIHAQLPQIAMDFPEFRKINQQFEIAVLIPDLQVQTIAEAINSLIEDKTLYQKLNRNCEEAKQVLNWQEEEKKLVEFYNKLF